MGGLVTGFVVVGGDVCTGGVAGVGVGVVGFGDGAGAGEGLDGVGVGVGVGFDFGGGGDEDATWEAGVADARRVDRRTT